jgi:hypothetical protein
LVEPRVVGVRHLFQRLQDWEETSIGEFFSRLNAVLTMFSVIIPLQFFDERLDGTLIVSPCH